MYDTEWFYTPASHNKGRETNMNLLHSPSPTSGVENEGGEGAEWDDQSALTAVPTRHSPYHAASTAHTLQQTAPSSSSVGSIIDRENSNLLKYSEDTRFTLHRALITERFHLHGTLAQTASLLSWWLQQIL